MKFMKVLTPWISKWTFLGAFMLKVIKAICCSLIVSACYMYGERIDSYMIRICEALRNSAKGNCSLLQKNWCYLASLVWNWKNCNFLFRSPAVDWLYMSDLGSGSNSRVCPANWEAMRALGDYLGFRVHTCVALLEFMRIREFFVVVFI